MKTTIHQMYRLLSILMTMIAVSACTVDSDGPHEHASLIEATASSASAISLTHYAVSASALHDQKDDRGLAGFTQLWSRSADSKSAAAASQPAISGLEGTHEYTQLQIAMRANDFERARKIASTSSTRAMVDREYQMHQEMLNTELITARADQEIGTTKER